jgi:hypothetical protein
MPATYEPIATTTLNSSATSVTFSSIPGTYTDLVLVLNGTSTAIAGLGFQFNGDTGNNYSATLLYGTGSAVVSSNNSNTSEGYSGRINTNQSISISHIMNYSNTTTYKTAVTRANSNGDILMANVCLWRSTSAITSIKYQGATFESGCVFTLYGIKAA